MTSSKTPSGNGPFALITSLFFMWGFLTSMNDVLIPFLKDTFALNNTQSVLIQTAFFGAYFIGSLIYFFLSTQMGDPILKLGYKNGILGGLFISSIGAILFFPAAVTLSFPFFLAAQFTLGLGFTLLQISANPYVTLLGSEETASARLNLSQGFNSLGTTLAPLIGGFLIFKYAAAMNLQGADAVKVPYLVFAGMLLLVALMIGVAKLPKVTHGEKVESGEGIFKFPQVWLGMAAIFFYVGSEVSVGSFLVKLFDEPEMGGLSDDHASTYVSLYWGGAMIGRFMGSVSLSSMADAKRKILLTAMAAIGCFAVILMAVSVKSGHFALAEIAYLLIPVAVSFIGFQIGKGMPARTMGIFALIVVGLLLLTTALSGPVAMWAVVGIGIFNSIMWSNVFSISLEGLGKFKSQASSLLVMMVIGGALFPLLQGWVADLSSVHTSYLVPIIGYVYLAIYGFFGPKYAQRNKANG